MDIHRIIDSLNTLQLDELRQVQAHVNDLIARLEVQPKQPASTEAPASYQAYQDMKAQAPEDLGDK